MKLTLGYDSEAVEGTEAGTLVIVKPDLTQTFYLYPGDRVLVRVGVGADVDVQAVSAGGRLDGLSDLLAGEEQASGGQ